MPITVSALGRKLRLLIDYGYFKDWNDLGNAFDRAGSTVQYWGHGSDDREAGTIPANRYETLIDIFASCLGERFSRDEVVRLIFASVAELEAELQAQALVSLMRLIELEAETGTGALFLMSEAEAGLIETDQEPHRPKPEHSVRLGQWFRLEFPARLTTGHIAAIQHSGQSWGAVPNCLADHTGLKVYSPGFRPNGEFAFMRERREAGFHRFVVLQTREPPPVEFKQYLADQIALDGAMLGRLARFYHDQPKTSRALQMLTLEVKP